MSELRFEGVWEQTTDVVVRKEEGRLVVELQEMQDGEVYARTVLDPARIACDIENGMLYLRNVPLRTFAGRVVLVATPE